MKITSAVLIGLLASGTAHAHSDETHATQSHEEASGHAAALGKPGDPAKVDRTIEITVDDDMRYSPDEAHIKRGQTVRFRVVNGGRMKHEMVLGTLAELKEHATLMRKFPEMEHDDPNAVSVEPGKMGELVWHFTEIGNFDFACLAPGHFEAGMRGRIVVRP
jgi:uncharacterized cupredoxin-like copper-binding protein